MLRAVIFDMDDTLLDWSAHTADWQEVRRAHLRPIYEHLLAAGYGLPDLNTVAEVYHEHNNRAWAGAAPPEWIAPRQIDVLRSALRALKLDPDSLDLNHIQHLFGWGLMPGVRPFPDAQAVLEAVRAAGLYTGLITNASSPMWMRDRELEALGLLHLLDVRVTAGDVGHLKPHPRPFQAVAEQLGVSADEAVFVGDRLQEDILGAQGAGMRAIWVRRDPHAYPDAIKPHAIVDSLLGLLEILDIWYPGWR